MRRVITLVCLLAMVALPASPASAYNAPGPRWPGKTIRYSESLPKSWNWGIRKAVKTWNSSGINVRFVKVPRARSQVRIGYGDANGSGGYASIGKQPGAYIEMNKFMYKPLRPEVRVVTSQLLAHELGHVLGLDHVSGKCRLMTATVLRNCAEPPQPWLYDCSWLSKDDVRGALRLYGGKARKPARTWCPLEPTPQAPQNVRFTSGDPVRISWTPPKSLRPRSSAVIDIYDQSRCEGDRSGLPFDTTIEDPTKGQWTDFEYRPPGTYCYEIRMESQYGQPSEAVRGLASYAPAGPASPILRSLTEYPDEGSYEYVADIEVPEGTTLHVDVSPSGQCTSSPQGTSRADQSGKRTWFLWGIPQGPSCLSFFSVGRVASAPLTVEVVHGPRPVGP